MPLLLAADSGGSKTRLCFYTEDGQPIAEYTCRGFGAADDPPDPHPELLSFLRTLSAQPDAVAVNLGGKNERQIKTSFEAVFPGVPIRVFRESEGVAALALGRKYGADIVLLAGTGSIAIGQKDGQYAFTDGWGALLGDAGSGYAIGAAAIRLALSALDGQAPLCALAKRITGCESPLPPTDNPIVFRDRRDRVREQIVATDRRAIAAYARVAAEAAREGDEVAKALFADAGRALAETVQKTADKLGKTQGHLLVTGGLCHAADLWCTAFEEALLGFTVQYLPDGLMEGVYEIARSLVRC